MGNVLTNCPNNGVSLSNINLNSISNTCLPVKYVAISDMNYSNYDYKFYNIATSPDGITWTGVDRIGNIVSYNGITYGNGLWVAVGDGVNASNAVVISTDGYNWSVKNFRMWCYGVAYGDGKWVVVGSGLRSPNTLISIDNGNTWNTISTITLNPLNDIAFGKDFKGTNKHLWIVVGYGGIFTSSDGVNWLSVNINSFSYNIKCVAFGKDNSNTNLCVVGGIGNGANTIATSPDGIIWTNRSKIINIVNGISYNGSNLWVAVGEGTVKIATSTNGTIWTGITTGINNIMLGKKITFTNNLWIFVGKGGETPSQSQYNIMTGKQSGTTITWDTIGRDNGIFNPLVGSSAIAYK